ncbi:hypothetical protein V500_04556 [Pseudogymnoascus sp. VKM F-4518 (FW-2643)]|nr:hypothetical protein V500_04556 [Pseudogymnoascus sp. VKM F-4518 (FW-2643)]
MCALGKQDLALGWRRRDTARDRPRSLAELMQFRSDLVSEPLKAARIAQSPGYKVGRVGTLLVLNNTYGSATLPLFKKTAVTGLTRSPSELANRLCGASAALAAPSSASATTSSDATAPAIFDDSSIYPSTAYALSNGHFIASVNGCPPYNGIYKGSSEENLTQKEFEAILNDVQRGLSRSGGHSADMPAHTLYSYAPSAHSTRSFVATATIYNPPAPSQLESEIKSKIEPSASSYGLIEEEFAGDDFQLLVVCIFLNKTKDDRAIPAARRLLLQYPKPEILANASCDDIKYTFRASDFSVGLCGSSNYPKNGVGLYASDAWRIFCKDNMYEKAGIKVMESEWKTVKPKDQELRSYLTWRWAKEGYYWDPETGVAIERSLEGSDCDLGMSCLTIDDSGGGRRLEQVRVFAYGASMALPKQILEGAKSFTYDSKTQEVCQLEEVSY